MGKKCGYISSKAVELVQLPLIHVLCSASLTMRSLAGVTDWSSYCVLCILFHLEFTDSRIVNSSRNRTLYQN